jgi:hypothetical protein
MRSAAAGWLLWVAVAFGLFGMGLSRHRFRSVESSLDAGRWPGSIDAIRAYVTNDGDVRRYFAYAEAARGRSYASYFVRTAEDWRKAFAAAEPYRPDAWPDVIPKQALVPYRDYLVEYPPGFFLAALPPSWVAHDADSYVRWFEALMALALTCALVLAAKSVGWLGGHPISLARIAVWGALSTLLLGVVATHRYDAAVALAMAGCLAALAAQRPIALGIALGIAIALKITPALMVPIVVMHAARERRYRDLFLAALATAASLALISLPLFFLAGKHILDLFRYHADRPVQIESTWGALLGLLHSVHPGWVVVEKTFGSTNVAGAFAKVAAAAANLATVAGLLAVYAVTWRRLASPIAAERGRAAFAATAAVFAAFVACGKVSSPQYLVWILPIGLALSLTDGRRVCLVLFLAFLALTQTVYPITYGRLEALRPGPCALVLARNVVLITWAALILGERRATHPRPVRSRSKLGLFGAAAAVSPTDSATAAWFRRSPKA